MDEHDSKPTRHVAEGRSVEGGGGAGEKGYKSGLGSR